MPSSKRLLEDTSWAAEGRDILVHDGLVVDNNVKTFVSPLGAFRKYAFAVTDEPVLFRTYFLSRGRLFLAVEHPHNLPGSPLPPMLGQVDRIDGKTFVMMEPLDHLPRPGACVALFMGYERYLIDEILAYEMDKEMGKCLWV